MKYRIEKDSFGEIKVDDANYWGAQTQRSLMNFNISKELMPLEIIHAIVGIKLCAAKANVDCKKMDRKFLNPIINACNVVLSGKLDKQFPLKVWQTGSGTQTNMNVNEVIANYVKKHSKLIVHPNDHVNMSQSTNDVFPSAIHIACCLHIKHKLLPQVNLMIEQLKKLEKQTSSIIKIGRTHLQDATPILLSQEIKSWRSSLDNCCVQLLNSLNYLYELPIGGTAVGTGINTPKNYANVIVKHLSNFYKLPFKSMEDKCCGLAFKERICATHGQIKNLATTLYKVANDIRFLSSGPRCGLNELIIPENEPGSSIMPGKVNPTQCEATMMACAEVIGNDVTISFSCTQGNFQLNVMMPVIGFKCIESINLLSDVINSLTINCIKGIKPNTTKINSYIHSSLMLVTALAPKIGYLNAAKLAKYAYINNLTLERANDKLKMISKDEFKKLMDIKKMVG